MDLQDLKLMLGQQDKAAVPQYAEPDQLVEQLARAQAYQPNGDEDVAAARLQALRKQGADMTGGMLGPNRTRVEFLNNNGLSESGADDSSRAEAFAKIRALLEAK